MIRICTQPTQKHTAFHYHVADRILSADFPIELLFACRADDAELPVRVEQKEHLFDLLPSSRLVGAPAIYNGKGWVGGQWRHVSVKYANNGYMLDMAGIGDFFIIVDGSLICFQWQSAQNKTLQIEAVLGPALTLALALQGTFCLHASAVAMNGQIVAFVGESGWGKSTLTAYLNAEIGNDWQFVADDVLPIQVSETDVVCLPHFPQLKLPADQQWGLDCPRRLPLTAVYLLKPPAQDDETIHIKPLTAVDATLALVRHTVAAKLFDTQLLGKHLTFAATVANQVPVKQLIYPRIYEQLPAVSSALIADLIG